MFRIKAPAAPVTDAAKTAVKTVTESSSSSTGNYFFHRKLQYNCHNGRSFQRFSASNAEILANYLCHYLPNHAEAIRTNRAPSITDVAQPMQGVTAPTLGQLLPPVHEQYFVAKDYIENVLNSKVRSDAPPPCVLPVPEVTKLHQQVLAGQMGLKEVEEMLQPRELFHISSVEGFEHYDWTKYGYNAAIDEIKGKIKSAEQKALERELDNYNALSDAHADFHKKTKRLNLKEPTEYSSSNFKVSLPRDALTGNYFQREEVVDNLLAAARHFKFENCFWIRSTHPQLHKYLKLAAPATGSGASGGNTIGSSVDSLAMGGVAVGGQDYASYVGNVPCLTLSLSSVVFFLEDLQPKFPVQFLHPLLVPDPSSPQVAGKSLSTCYDLLTNASQIKRGMNAATGFVSSNPYFHKTHEGPFASAVLDSSDSPSGVWLSLDQVLRYGLTLKDGKMPVVIVDDANSTNNTNISLATSAPEDENGKKKKKVKKPAAPKKGKKKSPSSAEEEGEQQDAKSSVASTNPFGKRHQRWTGNGKLIEIEEWELYNASQLSVPGRVSLKQAAVDENNPTTGLFQ